VYRVEFTVDSQQFTVEKKAKWVVVFEVMARSSGGKRDFNTEFAEGTEKILVLLFGC
jgi:hypothetical protein